MSFQAQSTDVGRRRRNLFENYQIATSVVPLWIWLVLRISAFLFFVIVVALAFKVPHVGAVLFWQIIIPLLPLLFVLAPGFWRNICPLGFANQIPRSLGISLGRSLPIALRERSFLVATMLFLALVLLRKPLLNDTGWALGAMLTASAVLALLGGLFYKGKSGWCGTFCPLAPIQVAYGHAPIVLVHNRYCRPCVGCQKNCYDFNPHAKMFEDLSDPSEEFKGHRKLFVGLLPGLVWAFFNAPSPSEAGIWTYLISMLHAPLLSLAAFHVLHYLHALSLYRIVQLFSLGAILLFYGFALPVLLGGLGNLLDFPALMPGANPRTGWVLAAAWFVVAIVVFRSFRQGRLLEAAYADAASSRAGAVSGGAAVLQRRIHNKEASVRVLERSSNQQIVVAPGQPLLEALEHASLPIQAGCRLGMCGADPILIVHGQSNLEPAGALESETLRRLGLTGRARLACMCSPMGPVTIDLDLSKSDDVQLEATAMSELDADLKGPRYVVVGNGIAGITFIDQLRTAMPDARIALVSREPHHFYNRMGIERVVYGRTAMNGLYLADDAWFVQHRVKVWLNTIATSIDRSQRQLVLATGERLAYDKLVLATGAHPILPSLPGRELLGCFVFREADDAVRLRSWVQAQRCESAVVLGGGILGIEIADALRRTGLSVTIIHKGRWLMDAQLDEQGGLRLAAFLQRVGVNVRTGVAVGRIHGLEKVSSVEIESGQRIYCQLFVACTGVEPNTDLAWQGALKVAKGVIVDDSFVTSDPDILAIGDVAESPSLHSGLWPIAVTQAKVAVAALCGLVRPAETEVGAIRLKLEGIDVRSCGTISPADGKDEIVSGTDLEGRIWRYLVLRGDVIAGWISIDDPIWAQTVSDLMQRKAHLATFIPKLRQGDWSCLREVAQSLPK